MIRSREFRSFGVIYFCFSTVLEQESDMALQRWRIGFDWTGLDWAWAWEYCHTIQTKENTEQLVVILLQKKKEILAVPSGMNKILSSGNHIFCDSKAS